MANVTHKPRLHGLLIAAGLPVVSLYNDASGNLALQWSSGPTPAQQTQATGIISAFDDAETFDELLERHGNSVLLAVAAKLSASFVTMPLDRQQKIQAIIDKVGTFVANL